MSASRPQAMLFGTYHMANPNLDAIKTDHADVLTEQRQHQIQEVVHRLKAFAPTHVAIEVEPDRMQAWQERYQQYLAGDLALGQNEIYQIGFRLAREMGHAQLFGIDHRRDLDIGAVMAYAADKGMTDLMAWWQRFTAELPATQKQIEAEEGVLGLLRYMNSPGHDANHALYMKLATVGAGESYLGASVVAEWYTRNLMMFANLARLVQQPSDRIFVLVGAGHRPVLRHYLLNSPDLDYVDAMSYLA
jgi:hypothetical protein